MDILYFDLSILTVKSMRILYVAQNYQPMSASSITIHGIIKKLAEKGHNVTLLVPQRCPKECVPYCSLGCKDDTAFTVVRVPTLVPHYIINKYRNIRALTLALSEVLLVLQSLRIGRVKKFNLVLSQHHSSHFASLSAFILSRIFKLPLVVRTHDVYDTPSSVLESLYLRTLDNIYRVVLKRADYVSVVSSPLRSRFIETHKLEEDRVLVFPNGVDIKYFRPDVRFGSLRSDLQVEGKKILLFTGSIIESRGLTLLARALPEIIARNSDVVVLVVGDGPQKSDLEKLAQQLGVKRFVRFIPPVDHSEVPKYICMSDVTIGPLKARIGTFGSVPRKVLEYMACAKPVVTCNGGVSQDLILDGYNGFLIHPGKIKELASIVLKIIGHPNLATEVGQNARENVENLYDWDRIINDFEKVLRVAVAGGKHNFTLKNVSHD